MREIKKITIEFVDGIEEVHQGSGFLSRNITYRVEEFYDENNKLQTRKVPVSQVWVSMNV
jgi:hypothetical protein